MYAGTGIGTGEMMSYTFIGALKKDMPAMPASDNRATNGRGERVAGSA